MKTITTITEYCAEVNIPPPKHLFFDIRKFEDKVKTENSKQAPFRHEFYCIALRHTGYNKHVNGQLLQANLFFNSPYQVISWDVLPDWKGWYIMFGHEFLNSNPGWNHFILDFPFFRLDKTIPMDLAESDVALANQFFEQIFEEYHSDKTDKFQFIQSYTALLLALTKRYFSNRQNADETLQINRTADLLLISRFETMIQSLMADANTGSETRQPSFYASGLNVHPNHLNAVTRRITGKTASGMIQHHIIIAAKSLLKQTSLPIKEISYRLNFQEPTHFNALFKKLTGLTPQQYRSAINL